MHTRDSLTHPNDLRAVQRRNELARILASGVLCLRQLRHRIGQAPAMLDENLPKSIASCLEVSDETVLSVHTG